MISQFEVGQPVRNGHVHIQTSGLGRLRKCPPTRPSTPYFLYQIFCLTIDSLPLTKGFK